MMAGTGLKNEIRQRKVSAYQFFKHGLVERRPVAWVFLQPRWADKGT